MPKREGELKSKAMHELRRQAPTFLVLLQATAGAPDRLIAGNGKMTAWEMKHATPDFEAQGNQTLFCMRLDALGIHTRYVIWHETPERTLIVRPKHVYDRTLTPEAWCDGFDMRWLVEQVRKAHV